MEQVGAGAVESAGAVSDVSSSTPSTGGAGDSGALLTDDAILGITPEGGSESTPTTPAATTETAATPAAIPAELSVDDFKALFPTNPKLQSLWDKYSSSQSLVTKFGTVADAGKAAEIVREDHASL